MSAEPLELTPREIRRITKRKRYSAQIGALRKLGFTVIVRPDGSPLVARENALQVLGVGGRQPPAGAGVSLDLS